MSHDMRFQTMWYRRPAKAQISLRIPNTDKWNRRHQQCEKRQSLYPATVCEYEYDRYSDCLSNMYCFFEPRTT